MDISLLCHLHTMPTILSTPSADIRENHLLKIIISRFFSGLIHSSIVDRQLRAFQLRSKQYPIQNQFGFGKAETLERIGHVAVNGRLSAAAAPSIRKLLVACPQIEYFAKSIVKW